MCFDKKKWPGNNIIWRNMDLFPVMIEHKFGFFNFPCNSNGPVPISPTVHCVLEFKVYVFGLWMDNERFAYCTVARTKLWEFDIIVRKKRLNCWLNALKSMRKTTKTSRGDRYIYLVTQPIEMNNRSWNDKSWNFKMLRLRAMESQKIASRRNSKILIKVEQFLSYFLKHLSNN